jgi:hypothetical protein
MKERKFLFFSNYDLMKPDVSQAKSEQTHCIVSSPSTFTVYYTPTQSPLPPATTAARSRQDSWASSAKKIRPLEKKFGRKPATPQNHQKKCSKKFLFQIFGPIFANYC